MPPYLFALLLYHHMPLAPLASLARLVLPPSALVLRELGNELSLSPVLSPSPDCLSI
jgi:hypothetical protein